jgi:flagellar FliL protein
MADDKGKAEPAAGGGRKKLIIMISVAVLLMLLGAGAAAFFLMGSGGDVGQAEQQEPAVEEIDPVYHKFAPEFVVNLAPGGAAEMLQVAIEVLTRNPGVVETLAENDPMIRHHLLNLLEQQQAAELLSVEGKQALQTAIHELLNAKLAELEQPGEVAGVFFTQFVMQ